MSLIEKYKKDKLTTQEKKDFLKICFSLEVEEFEDWLNELKTTKKVKSAFYEITKSVSFYDSFSKILTGMYEPITWIYKTDYETIFDKNEEVILYNKFLSNIGITPKKIDDLLIALSFNVSNDTFDNVDEESILLMYKEIFILKSEDFSINE